MFSRKESYLFPLKLSAKWTERYFVKNSKSLSFQIEKFFKLFRALLWKLESSDEKFT